MYVTSNARSFECRPLARIANLFIIATLLLCAQTVSRAQGVNATLSGTVTDQTGAVLSGASIKITNPETGFQREAQTNDDGFYNFPALPPATYVISADKEGFALVEISELKLNVNDDRSLRIEMRVGEVGELVTVTDEPSLVDESPAQATVIDREFVENLPLNGRSFQSLLLLSPGVVQVQAGSNPGQFSVNGQRANANYFTVDGVSANVATNTNTGTVASLNGQTLSGTVPGLSAVGTTSNLVPVDALEEFKIQTSTYSAEFGRQPGGQVQLVTRSGKSRFSGSIFDYMRNEAFDANNFFNNARGIKRLPLRQNQFGGTFSGPVILPRFGEGTPAFYNGKQRTFFFFSYEGLRLLLPQTTSFNVPSLRLRQIAAPSFQPILNAYPLPTGDEIIARDPLTGALGPGGFAPFNAGYSNPSSSDSYGIRIDHTLTNSISLFGRYSETPSKNLTRTLSQLSGARNNFRTLTLGTTLAGKTIANELRFNFARDRGRNSITLDDFGGAVPVNPSMLIGNFDAPGVRLGEFLPAFGPNIPILSVGDSQDSFNQQFNIVNNLSVVAGNHQLKFGVDYRRLMPTYGPIAYGRSTTLGFAFLAPLGVAQFQSIFSRQGADVRFNNYSFFVQDDWKATRRLTFNLGLRYELNPAPYDVNGIEPIVLAGINGADVSGATLAPKGTPFFKSFKTAFAPRLGAAYQLSDKPGRETVLRGGFGVYYDLGSSLALSGFNTFPFQASRGVFGQPFPLPTEQSFPPSFSTVTLPIDAQVFASDPDLSLPYTFQWNIGVERSLGRNQAISVSYVASAGRSLLTNQTLNPRNPTTGQFANPNFQFIRYATNGPTSDYHSLQTQFQRRLTRGFQALVNYTWSHAIDEASDEISGDLARGNASFDVRHNFSTAFTYEIPTFTDNRFARAVFGGFAIDSTIYLQSGQPIDITAGTITTEDGRIISVRPDYVAGQPFYIEQTNVPGGRRINPAAFVRPPLVGGAFTRQGTLGRNVVMGPAIFQVNKGLRREFGLTERLRLLLRAEAFNLFNRPQFSGFGTSLTAPALFGIPTNTLNRSLGGINQLYQLGGPRSLQFSAKIVF